MLQLASLLVVAWLPGAVIFRFPLLDRERRAALDPGERLFWTVILSLAVSLTAVLVLASAHRYSFPRLLVVNGTGALVAIAIGRGALRLNPPRRVSAAAIVPIALALFCAVRFSPPSEYVMGGKDPGVYVNEGIQIAQRGALLVDDPVIAALPHAARDLFIPQHRLPDGTPRTDYYSPRFMGFFVQDADRGTVVGQFPHLFPASIAIGYGINGLSGALHTVCAWAVLGILAVYFLAARLFGRAAAAAAAALLAVNVIEVWFARYPNAEVVMQTLLCAALLANARAHVDGDRFFAPVAGALLGLLLFLRFDAVLGVAGLALGVAAGVPAGQKPRLSMVAAFALFAVPALYYFVVPMRAYAELPIVWISAIPAWQVGIIGAAGAAGVLLLHSAARWPRVSRAFVHYVPLALAGGLWALAIYALLFRHSGGRLAAHDANALRTYADFYVTLPAVATALLGFAMHARRSFWRDPAFFVTVALFAVFVFYKIRIVPEHFWAARRFLPVVLPGTLVFVAAAAFGSVGQGWRLRVLRPVLGVIFVALLGSQYVHAGRPVAEHVEYAGLIPMLEHLAGRFSDQDLVIVEGRDAGSDVHVIALPLAYIYARNVLVLQAARPDKPAFAAFLEWAYTKYQRVFFVGGGGTDLLSHRYDVRTVASERFQVPEYDSALNAYPRFVRRKDFEFGVYQFERAKGAAKGMWFDLDVGTSDDLHVLRLHGKEQVDTHSFRWTRATSYLSITTISGSSRELVLSMADGGRSPAAPPARVDVFLHNQQLGSVVVSGGFRGYAFSIPPDLALRAEAANDPVELKLVSVTWNPAVVAGSPDDRDLGVMLDRATIR
ncbi:MAG: glycosyltransferase family 39 protein [Vicinamibacterales bacterium]